MTMEVLQLKTKTNFNFQHVNKSYQIIIIASFDNNYWVMMNKPMFIAFLGTGTLKEWGAYNFPPLKRGFGGLEMGAKKKTSGG